MSSVKLQPKVLISETELMQRVDELAADINKTYANIEQPLVIICVLKGAILFCADLMKRLTIPCQVEFIRLQSYGSERYSSGQVKAVDAMGNVLPNLTSRDILVVEDIIDTGLTLSYFIKEVKDSWQTNSIKIAVMLDKKEMRKHDMVIDFCAFEIPNHFVVGYGLDDNEQQRNLPYIGVVE